MKHIKAMSLSAFLDGEVSEEERIRISKHLRDCSRCGREAEELSRVSEFFGLIKDVEVPQYFVPRLKRRIAEEEKAPGYLRVLEWTKALPFARAVVPVGAAAFLVLAALLGNHLGTTIYQGSDYTTPGLDSEFADVFNATSFDDFPQGSLGDVYVSLFTQGGE